jgi:hypothetical protein
MMKNTSSTNCATADTGSKLQCSPKIQARFHLQPLSGLISLARFTLWGILIPRSEIRITSITFTVLKTTGLKFRSGSWHRWRCGMLSTGELKSTPIFSNICVSALGAIFKLMPHFGDRGALQTVTSDSPGSVLVAGQTPNLG